MKTSFPSMKVLLPVVLCGVSLTAFSQHASAAPGNAPIFIGAIELVGKHGNRDVVVVGKDKIILADSVRQNIGTKYPHDKGGEVTQTLADGKVRTFEEKSVDYPKGIKETVTAITDAKGKVIGAVIISNTLK